MAIGQGLAIESMFKLSLASMASLSVAKTGGSEWSSRIRLRRLRSRDWQNQSTNLCGRAVTQYKLDYKKIFESVAHKARCECLHRKNGKFDLGGGARRGSAGESVGYRRCCG